MTSSDLPLVLLGGNQDALRSLQHWFLAIFAGYAYHRGSPREVFFSLSCAPSATCRHSLHKEQRAVELALLLVAHAAYMKTAADLVSWQKVGHLERVSDVHAEFELLVHEQYGQNIATRTHGRNVADKLNCFRVVCSSFHRKSLLPLLSKRRAPGYSKEGKLAHILLALVVCGAIGNTACCLCLLSFHGLSA